MRACLLTICALFGLALTIAADTGNQKATDDKKPDEKKSDDKKPDDKKPDEKKDDKAAAPSDYQMERAIDMMKAISLYEMRKAQK